MNDALVVAAQTERMRNVLSFLLVGSFISIIPAAMVFVIPAANKDLVTYMVGQLSGMALTALGFYFVNKVGQDALDAKRADNTGKLADAVAASVQVTAPDVLLKPGETARAEDNPA